ncbi:MAG TPA: copper amine oxidase N-terminal domain-containing protein, partial [Firmicutes bacterium]|nr:copper amine oxidase N-terminal domain-containing protein [Bacillota bacterium]
MAMRKAVSGALVLAWAIFTLALPAQSAVTDEVSVTLTGGEVAGRVRGTGKATVQARVENLGTRALNGIRIEAFYSTTDVLPDQYAVWHPHEFIFEPPLPPGESTLLNFSDEQAAEYILIEVRSTLFALGLSYNGTVMDLKFALPERRGVVFIATRDFAGLVGAEAKYDEPTQQIVVATEGIEAGFTVGSQAAVINGRQTVLAGEVFEFNGTSYLPLLDAAT